MFENTLYDLIDCKRNLQDRDYSLDGVDEDNEKLSKSELRAAKQLLMLCRELAETFEDELEEIDTRMEW
jgi:hypothetical protein